MHPSKVTLRPKVRRPMAWDSTKSAPSAQQPEPSTQGPISGGYRRAETRHHRIDHPAQLREDAQQPDMIAAIIVAKPATIGPRGGSPQDQARRGYTVTVERSWLARLP